MIKDRFRNLITFLGVGLVCWAAWIVSPAFGVFVTGAALIGIAALTGDEGEQK